jgi:oligopeptide/dipeptide ABC transporter ATP-binding protein
LLEITNLRVRFTLEGATIDAVDGVSFSLPAGRTLGVVGESGSGKSVSMLAVAKLLAPNATASLDRLRFDGVDVDWNDDEAVHRLRGRGLAYVFQDPSASLNPVLTIGEQVREAVVVGAPGLAAEEQRRRAVEALRRVALPEPEKRYDAYPHQMSGGQRQRVLLAIALAAEPKVLVADEPTTALDVTVQAQLLALLDELRRSLRLSVVLISHDFGVIGALADDVAVFYAGRIVELGPVEQVLGRPRHRYTAALLRSLGELDRPAASDRRLHAIPGQVPDPRRWPSGCRFRERCAFASARCAAEAPPLLELDGVQVACWHPENA